MLAVFEDGQKEKKESPHKVEFGLAEAPKTILRRKVPSLSARRS
jgi:hypothetical protein